MFITINGEKKECPEDLRLHGIIGQFCRESRHVIAELNGQIVKAPSWENTVLKDGDRLELVSFVGGG